MTQRYFVPDLRFGAAISLSSDEARHALTVMRLKPGAKIQVFDGLGSEAIAEIVSIDRRHAQLMLCEPPQLIDRERHPSIHLAVALPKGDRQRWLVEKAVELGAASLTPIHAQRSVAKVDEDAVERLERAVIEASKQCGRNQCMTIGRPCDFHTYVSRQFEPNSARWFAHVSADGLPTPSPDQSRYCFIGPEGGFSEEEVAAALEHGWQAVSLGPRILRTETAAIAMLCMP